MSNYLLVLVAALAYWAWANRAALSLYARVPFIGHAQERGPEWTEGWVKTLIRLQAELEEEGQADAAALSRELIWRLLGGEPHSA